MQERSNTPQTEDLTFRASPKKARARSGDAAAFTQFVSCWEAKHVTAESKAEAEALLAPGSACTPPHITLLTVPQRPMRRARLARAANRWRHR